MKTCKSVDELQHSAQRRNLNSGRDKATVVMEKVAAVEWTKNPLAYVVDGVGDRNLKIETLADVIGALGP